MLLMMACNDNNGIHQTYADEIQFERDGAFHLLLKLEGSIPCEMTVAVARGVRTMKLRLGRRNFPIEGYCTWVGNMCWDAARISDETAEAIANYLMGLKRLDCTEGESTLYEAWHARQPIHFQGEQ